jgi:hypothetical protein
VLERDDDLPAGVAGADEGEGLCGVAERVGPVDDRCDPAGFDELLEGDEVSLVLALQERPQRLAGERRAHAGRGPASEGTDSATDPMEVGVGPGDRVPEDLTVTVGRRDQADQHADRGGLAGAVRTDEPGHPTFG